MKKLLIYIGDKTRQLSTRGSLVGILLSHACCLPALAGLASISLSTMQFIGPQFHLIIKIFFILAFVLQLLTMIYRILVKQFMVFHAFFYPILFGGMGVMIYSLWRYVDQNVILLCMSTVFIASFIDIFVKSRGKKKACCHVSA